MTQLVAGTSISHSDVMIARLPHSVQEHPVPVSLSPCPLERCTSEVNCHDSGVSAPRANVVQLSWPSIKEKTALQLRQILRYREIKVLKYAPELSFSRGISKSRTPIHMQA